MSCSDPSPPIRTHAPIHAPSNHRSNVRATSRRRGILFSFPSTLLVACANLALVFGPLVGPAAAQADVELKLATLAPEGSTWMKIMHELDDRIREETAEGVGFKFYPGGIQGDEPVVLRKIRTGQLHGAGFTGVGLGEIAPSLRVLEIPFLFDSTDEVKAVHDALDPLFESRLKDAGFTLLGWADVGFVYLYSEKPIADAQDLKAQKLWLWEGDPLAEAFLAAADVSPVPLSITDVVTSLQTGLISAVYVAPLACIALQWFTRVSYTTDLPITHASGAVVVSNKIWDKIPPDQQETVKRLCDEHFERLRVATIEENDESIQVILESGVEKVTPSASAVESFRAIGQEVARDLAGEMYDAELLERVRSEVQSARRGASSSGKASP